MSMRSFSEMLCKKRNELGMSLKAAGKAIGTSGSYLCNLESKQFNYMDHGGEGKQGPTLGMLLKIGRVYSMTLDQMGEEFARPDLFIPPPKKEEMTYAKLR